MSQSLVLTMWRAGPKCCGVEKWGGGAVDELPVVVGCVMGEETGCALDILSGEAHDVSVEIVDANKRFTSPLFVYSSR